MKISSVGKKIAIVFGLFMGVIFAITLAAAVTAVYPKTAYWVESFVCSKSEKLQINSQKYSYRPGQRGVARNFRCVKKTDPTHKPRNVDLNVFGYLFLLYLIPCLIIDICVLMWMLSWFQKRLKPFAVSRTEINISHDGSGHEMMQRIPLAVQTSKSSDRQPPKPEVDTQIERLERLAKLRADGTITDEQFESMKKDVLRT